MSTQSKVLLAKFVCDVCKELTEKEINDICFKNKTFIENCFISGLSEDETVIEVWKMLGKI